ncbi:MAG: MerR family transcriptional regulator [Candidatus Omnitrophica bacterium]|nr:MerR family transcriptional regulator [Candidatus Omnitrophota bacterium]
MTADKNKRDFYWAQEVADRFGISKKTLLGWEKEGKISNLPKDWRGWRMYGDRHLKQVGKVIEAKKNKNKNKA